VQLSYYSRSTWIEARAIREQSRSRRAVGAVRAANVHADDLRSWCTCVCVACVCDRWAAHDLRALSASVNAHERARARVRESLFPSVSEDQWPWPRDHERWLIRYISARALRYISYFPYILAFARLSPRIVRLEREDRRVGSEPLKISWIGLVANCDRRGWDVPEFLTRENVRNWRGKKRDKGVTLNNVSRISEGGLGSQEDPEVDVPPARVRSWLEKQAQ